MTAKQYLRLSLLLPFVLPVVAFLLRVSYNLAAHRTWGDLGGPAPLVYVEAHLLFSVVFGGLQYLVFAIWAWPWIPKQSVGRILVVLGASPLLVLGIHSVAWGVVRFIAPRSELVALLGVLWMQFLYVGYFYVALVLGAYWFLKGRCLSYEPSNNRMNPAAGSGFVADS